MRSISPSPLACGAVCALTALAWSAASALAARGALPGSQHGDVLVLLVCAAAYLVGTAGPADRQRPRAARAAEPAGAEEVLERFGELVQRGCLPDRVALNRALDACSKLGRVAQAQQLFEQMPRYGLAPNANSYGVMITVYVSGNMAREAMSVFESMREEGVEPSRQVYHDLLRCCVKLHRLDDALAVYNQMARAGVRPQEVTCERLGRACQKRGWSRIKDQITRDLPRVRKAEIELDDCAEVSTDFESTEADAESE